MDKRVYENPIFGDKAVFLKTSEETNGEYTLIEIELAPGGKNSLHYHKEFTETFTAIDGPLEVQISEKKILNPGEKFTVPLNVRHLFKNPIGQTIKFQVELRPGHTGFENAIKIAYGLAKDGLTDKKGIPKKLSHLAVLATMGGTYPAGFASVIMPLLRWKAAESRKKGVEEELIKKYCQ